VQEYAVDCEVVFEFDLTTRPDYISAEFFLVFEWPEGDLAVLAARDRSQVECVAGYAPHNAVVSRGLAIASAEQTRLHVVEIDVPGGVAD